MNAIRIRRQLDSDTLFLPEVKPFIGRTVEIIILEDSAAPPTPSPLAKFLALAPPDKPFDPAELDAMRSDPKYARFYALLEAAGLDIIDPEAIAQLRATSLL